MVQECSVLFATVEPNAAITPGAPWEKKFSYLIFLHRHVSVCNCFIQQNIQTMQVPKLDREECLWSLNHPNSSLNES